MRHWLKALQRVTLVAVICGGAMLAVSLFRGREDGKGAGERAAMVRVIRQSNEAAAKSLTVLLTAGGAVTNLDAKGYAAGLRRIEYDDCPKDFMRAWAEVVNATERAGEGPGAGIGRGVRFGLKVLQGAPSEAAAEVEGLDVAESWRKLRVVLAGHGVSLTTD